MNVIVKSVLFILAVFVISAYILQWAVNLWLIYFHKDEITFWHSFSIFVILGMIIYYYNALRIYLDGKK